MNKKVVVIILVIAFALSGVSIADAADSASMLVSVTNSLPLPVYKKVDVSVSIPNIMNADKIAVFLKGKEIPIQLLSRSATSLRFSTVLSFTPYETKILILKYGKDIAPSRNLILYKPNFSGTYFVGIGSGKLYIISLADNNNISVKSNNGNILFSATLNKKEYKAISLSRDQIFTIRSEKPVFAEVSSLKENCLKNSSDDVSSVYGTYFLLFIPREIVVSSYVSTKLLIKTMNGSVVYSGTLPPRGQYKNFSLKSGVYEVLADNPVTIQFGCEDDNIYAINYGAPNEFKGVSYGDVVCSALFPDTKVQIKTPFKTYPSVNLENPGDYTYKTLITKYKDSYTETMPVFIQYSKPILIYSDSNHGNIGGEQIPPLFGHSEHYMFLTGKIFNFDGLVHKRKVVIIPTLPDTTIKLNGKQYVLKSALMPKTFLFGKSYTAVKIDSNKPISVFDVGITTSIEFLSMLLPLKDNSVSYTLGTIPPKVPSQSNNGAPEYGQNTLSKYITPIAGFFTTVWNGIEKTSIYKSVSNTLSQFWQTISPSLNNLSKQIIALFIPVAQMVYPYIHPYFSNLTISELAAILFYLLIILIIILLIPKRRRKQISVEKVTEAELKKKGNVAFNIRTIEEKGLSGIKEAPAGRPKMLSPKYAKKSEITAPKKGKAVEVKRKSITLGVGKTEEKKIFTKSAKQPLQIFKHPTKVENVQKQEEKSVEKLSAEGHLPIKEKSTTLEKSVKNVPLSPAESGTEAAQKSAEELKKELALKKILSKNISLEQSKNAAKTSTEEKEVIIKGRSLSESKSPEVAIESERIAEVLRKLKETTAKISEQSKKLERADRGEEKIVISAQPSTIKPGVSTPAPAKKKEKPTLEKKENTLIKKKEEAVSEKNEETTAINEEVIIKEKKESVIEKAVSEKEEKKPKESSSRAFGIGRLLGRKGIRVSKPVETKESTVPALNEEKKLLEEPTSKSERSIKEEPKVEKTVGNINKEKSLETPNEPAKEEIYEQEKLHTSLSELIEKVKKEPLTRKNAEVSISKEIINKVVTEEEKVEQPVAISISGSAALDSSALSSLYKLHALEHLSRIMISAKDQPNVDPDIKAKYRISVISLTGIELRISEDLARRIGAKKSTGELLLIAKKTRINKIIVDDKPEITNYQGIKIIDINDLTNQK